MNKQHEESLRLLEGFMKNNPEEVKRMVAEVDAMGFGGPTVDEYFESFGGYTEKDMALNTIKELEAILKDSDVFYDATGKTVQSRIDELKTQYGI